MPKHAIQRRTVGTQSGIGLGQYVVDEVASTARRPLYQREVVRREQRCPKDFEKAACTGTLCPLCQARCVDRAGPPPRSRPSAYLPGRRSARWPRSRPGARSLHGEPHERTEGVEQ